MEKNKVNEGGEGCSKTLFHGEVAKGVVQDNQDIDLGLQSLGEIRPQLTGTFPYRH